MAILIMTQGMIKTVLVTGFAWQQQRIAATLCVQKEVKENSCQGHCVLERALEKANEPAAPAGPQKSVKDPAPEAPQWLSPLAQFSFQRELLFELPLVQVPGPQPALLAGSRPLHSPPPERVV